MKIYELKKAVNESAFPIKAIEKYDGTAKYFVAKEGFIGLFRYIDNKYYVISLQSYGTWEWTRPFEELCDVYDVFCIPAYTGGIDGAAADRAETETNAGKLLVYMIEKYLNQGGSK